MWNLRKLTTYYGFNLLNKERAKHPELDGQIDPCEIPTEAELLKFRPYAELTRIELQYDVEGIVYADQIPADMDGPVRCDREMQARFIRDKKTLKKHQVFPVTGPVGCILLLGGIRA